MVYVLNVYSFHGQIESTISRLTTLSLKINIYTVDCKSAVWPITMATKVTVTTWTSQSKVVHKEKPVYLEKLLGGGTSCVKKGGGATP